MKHPARSRGFTMIELMVTLTILAIMVGLAVPSFRSFVANQKVKTAAHELMTAVLIARSEAIKRNATVTLTPSSGSAWASGWSVAAAGTTLQSQTAMDVVAITPKDPADPSVATTLASVSFGNTGRPTAMALFEITGGSDAVRCVRLDAAGIPSSFNRRCS